MLVTPRTTEMSMQLRTFSVSDVIRSLEEAPPLGRGVRHVCKVKAFTNTYRSENASRGRAHLDVLKQCRAKHHEMFCVDEEVECTEYK
ncbi:MULTISPECIES: hypothetical protein [Moraxella]|uniref:hypothetical protein n=1 Tax=Moraxella TaxID=475 RepID=UPI001D170818|nr:hypothetical protein [Moraxella lacunata]